MRECGKERRWEDEKVGKKQDWGMGGMEGGIRNAEGTDTRFIILDNTIGPQSHDFALL